MLWAQSNLYLNGNITVTNGSELSITGDLVNRPGGEVVFINGGAIYVDGDVTNNGSNALFVNSDGEIVLRGTLEQRINGTTLIDFFDLTLNKPSGQLIIDNDIAITSNLSLVAGNLFLNGNNVNLGTTGSLLGENNNSYVYGFPGSITASGRFLNSPSINDNIAGMGLYIGSGHGYGSTHITRIHKVLESPGNGSILMYYEFAPQFDNLALSDQVAIDYYDHQLAGLSESNLSVWKSLNNGVTWAKFEGSLNTSLNQAVGNDVTEITSPTFFTLAERDCINDPLVDVGDAMQSFCTGNSLVLDAGASGLIYEWYKDGVLQPSETTEFLTVTEPGTYLVQGVNANGCDAQDQVIVLEKAIPTVDFSVSPGCVSETLNFTNNSISTDGTLTYAWDFGDGTTSTDPNPQHEYLSDGSFTVTLEAISTFGCEEMTMDVVVISPLPTADFTAETVCLGDVTVFNDASIIPPGFAVNTYQWNFGDGNTSNLANPTHEYATPGVYTSSLLISTNAGCTDLQTREIVVNERPVADFDVDLVCSTNTFIFSNTSTVTDLKGYLWDFDNGETSSFESPTIIFDQEGTFNVSLTVETVYGCLDQYDLDVDVVAPLPIFPSDVETCGTSFLLDADPAGVYAGSDFLWSTTQTTSSINATSNGVYTVTITEPNGCVTVGSTFVRLNEPISIDLEDQINGCDELILDAGFFSGATYAWSTGETTQRITVTESSNYSISITDNNGCTSSKDVNVTVNTSLSVDLGEDLNLCFGESAVLDAGNSGNTYLWSNGATTQTITVDRPNEYWVDVTSPSTGCTTRDNILVFIYEEFDIDLGSDRITCPGSPVTLTAPIDEVQYLWSGDTGEFGTAQSQTFENPGKYWLTVTNAAGCQAADTILIEESFNSVTADFIANSLVDEGDTIQFINLSFPDPTGYVWDFGDGTTSTDFEPQKVYLTEGSYAVQLSATNGTCTNVLTKVITVRPLRDGGPLNNDPLIYPEIVDTEAFPNPVTDVLNFRVEANTRTLIYADLITPNGSVLSWKEYNSREVKDRFTMTELVSGMYLLRLKVGKEVKIFRVLKR